MAGASSGKGEIYRQSLWQVGGSPKYVSRLEIKNMQILVSGEL